MIRTTLCEFTLLALCTPVLAQQAPGQQAPGQQAPSAVDTAFLAQNLSTEQKECVKEAAYTPAEAYCTDFVTAASKSLDASKPLDMGVYLKLDGNLARLANAYAAYKLTAALQSSVTTTPNLALKTQSSAPATTSGSTSLVAKTSQTSLLAIAVESGALSQSQNGNLITLQANVDHLFQQAFMGSPNLRYVPDPSNKLDSFLEDFTASASLATDGSSSLSVPTSGSANSGTINATSVTTPSTAAKLSSLSVTYDFVNPFSMGRMARYKGDVVKTNPTLYATAGRAAAQLGGDFFNPVQSAPAGCDSDSYQPLAAAYAKIAADPKTRNQNNRFAGFIRKLNTCFSAVAKSAESNPNLDQDMSAYTTALSADIESYQKALRTGFDASAQYVFNKPQNQPETHDFRLILTGDLSKTGGSVWTVNAATSIYGSLPAGAQYGRFKDAQFSAEFDRTLGSKTGSPSVGLAGYGQYQSSPSVLNITSASVPSDITLPSNAQVFLQDTQGWLGIVQAKLTLHVGTAQIPLAAKWSNKTDLLDTRKKLNANFGVSYDFNQLGQLIGLGSN